MLTKSLTAFAALLGCATSALAEYNHRPFHDRPLDVARLAMAVRSGDPLQVPTDDVALVAAVAAFLLVSELGLAEAYEEAVAGDDEEGEGDADADKTDGYPAAYALLQDLKPWLVAVPQNAETRDLIARLDGLMPTPERPETMDRDPEAAEVLAQALVGQLERAADADLYLGRDLRHAMETVAGLAAKGCEETGPQRAEIITITSFYFEDSLEAPLSIMASEPAERIELALDSLRMSQDISHACQELANGFADARKLVFP